MNGKKQNLRKKVAVASNAAAPAEVPVNVKPIGLPLQKMLPEVQEELGVHPVTRSFLSQYDAAIQQNMRLIEDAQAKVKQIEFAKNQLLRLEIAREGLSVAPTKPLIAHSEDYSTITFFTPGRRLVETTATV